MSDHRHPHDRRGDRRRHDPAIPWDAVGADDGDAPHDARIVHPHGPPDGHDHHHLRGLDRRRLVIVLSVTAGVLVAEVVGGLLAGSLALLSDAGHMLTDLSAQVLSLLALLFAVRPADARRTYGYYRLEILAALANGVVLVLLALFIMVQAYQRLSEPPEVRTSILLAVAAVGLGANLLSASLLRHTHSLNVRGAYLHVLSDALSSVAVLVGGVAMALTGFYVIDPILGFLIGAFVIFNAWRLIREAVDVLLEAVPADIDLEEVRRDVALIDGIEDVHDLHIWTITSGLHALSAHIVVANGTSNDALLTTVKTVLLRHHRIAHSTLQVESPDYQHVGHVY